ncbi:leucine-rich repeat protein, partial [Klebsiella pneumoniae]
MQLPESLLCIGMDAFCGCIRLRSVVIPGQVREIEEGAFAGCLNLASVQ